MTTLFVLRPARLEGAFRLRWPELATSRDEFPVLLEAEMDFWEGDEVLELAKPWLLVTAGARDAIHHAGLVGLRSSALPSLRYSATGAIRATLGEFAARELPEFCVARTESVIRVFNQDGEDHHWSVCDQLNYRDWTGDDFAQSWLGPVVTERAMSVLLGRTMPHATFLQVSPAEHEML